MVERQLIEQRSQVSDYKQSLFKQSLINESNQQILSKMQVANEIIFENDQEEVINEVQ